MTRQYDAWTFPAHARRPGMDMVDTGHPPLAVLDERRRRAGKLRKRGMMLREVAAQVGLSAPTAMAADRAYRESRAAVNVKW